MILKLFNLFLFWRRNNLPSIIFKSLVWGGLAWLFVGIFTSFKTAVIGGLAASLLAGCKYSLKYFKRRKQLLAKVGGDKEKLKRLEKVTNKGGLGGALFSEMLNEELGMEDDDDDDSYDEEISEEQRAANIAATEKLCTELSDALVKGNHVSLQQCEEATTEITEGYESGEDMPTPIDLLHAFLPQSVLTFMVEDYCNDDDHAALVDMFAESTLGKWDVGNTSSRYDEDADKWLIDLYDNGEKKTWRFSQSADHLNQKFLDQLIQHTQSRSGHIIECLDAEDEFVEMTSLPADIHNLLFADSQQKAA